MARMTMGQWREQLGDAVALEEAPRKLGVPSMALLRAVKTGKVPLHTFRAADGRVFRMVKAGDVQAYQGRMAPGSQGGGAADTDRDSPQPAITMEGMKAAFKEMAES